MAEPTGTEPSPPVVLDQPFVPAVVGVAAPASWPAELAESLKADSGDVVHTSSPSPSSDTFSSVIGGTPGEVVEELIYDGVERVSADFVVRCRPEVRGTFVGWSSMTVGAVTCQYQEFPEYDAFQRLALHYCSRSPAPAPSEPPGD
ncbi:hypothetical protein [Spirilliplanes yamanashiensis]|nr:hypothetical protein [Spirilliplanes yamanashiensis]MDP9815150.1 hypothetical protein [Spirilliplanes yamanashiensis]